MPTKRFINASHQNDDPMRVPPTLATSKVPALQPLRGKMVMLDADDPGYTTEHALRVKEGKALLLSYAVEMHLIASLMAHDPEHSEAMAREVLAQLVVGHNLRAAAKRTDAQGALAWLKENLIEVSPQWESSELAQAMNERDSVRREAARESRNARRLFS